MTGALAVIPFGFGDMRVGIAGPTPDNRWLVTINYVAKAHPIGTPLPTLDEDALLKDAICLEFPTRRWAHEVAWAIAKGNEAKGVDHWELMSNVFLATIAPREVPRLTFALKDQHDE